ncbi:hypothetical protein [Plebeiibacterium sediminum]|uniref:Uncharacterized protein n=1 Tax=Plebeiibacterium sediminum TaxID=2992112 RepID=A0AAE3M4U2_9BACT|nr:hypothetical protein [Plebeiobacterium sediminum]MCW3787271.1 hypothetical protein [Plebeiobacterium sediminum]
MKRFKQISFFILSTIVTGLICCIIMVFAIILTCKSFGIRFEQSNLWGTSILFYLTLLLFPISYFIQIYNRHTIKIPKYFTWLIYPMLYVIIYTASIVLGLVYQYNMMGISEELGLFDQPVAINFNLKMLSYFYTAGILFSIVIEGIICKKILQINK